MHRSGAVLAERSAWRHVSTGDYALAFHRVDCKGPVLGKVPSFATQSAPQYSSVCQHRTLNKLYGSFRCLIGKKESNTTITVIYRQTIARVAFRRNLFNTVKDILFFVVPQGLVH